MLKVTSIIIVTYNAMPWIDRCLQSTGNYHVVIVDNDSRDQTVAHIKNKYPKVTLLQQDSNLGFGQGNNVGIRYAFEQGVEHVFLLNQDAYIIEDALEQLIKFQKKHPQYGILSPLHLTENKTQLDKRFSNYMLREKTGQFYSDFVLGNPIASVYEVPFVNAAAWLLSRECLDAVGGFDPLFFHYGEDDNFCQRVLYHGYKIGVLPKSYVIHDRTESLVHKPKVFSEAYYKAQEKQYKIMYANILHDNQIEKRISKLSRVVIKLKLKLKFRRAKEYQRELHLLKGLMPLIALSRERNQKKGDTTFKKKLNCLNKSLMDRIVVFEFCFLSSCPKK